MPVMTELNSIEKALGNEAKHYLEHQCKGITKDQLHLPGPDFIDRIGIISEGRLLASGTIDELKELTGKANLEDVFVHLVRNAAQAAVT